MAQALLLSYRFHISRLLKPKQVEQLVIVENIVFNLPLTCYRSAHKIIFYSN